MSKIIITAADVLVMTVDELRVEFRARSQTIAGLSKSDLQLALLRSTGMVMPVQTTELQPELQTAAMRPRSPIAEASKTDQLPVVLEAQAVTDRALSPHVEVLKSVQSLRSPSVAERAGLFVRLRGFDNPTLPAE